MALVVSLPEVRRLLSFDAAVEVTRQAFREQAAGGVVPHPPFHIGVPGGALRVVSGALRDSGRAGVRVGFARSVGVGSGEHVAAVFDNKSGRLLGVLAHPFGDLRTGVTMAVATALLAPAGAQRVGLIGTGRNALSLLEGVRHARPLGGVRVFSRSAENRAAFAERARGALGVPVEAVADGREAVAGAGIVLVATSSDAPVVSADWLAPGAFVGSMGRCTELGDDVWTAARRVVLSCRAQEEQPLGGAGTRVHPLFQALAAGRVDPSGIEELGAVLVAAEAGSGATAASAAATGPTAAAAPTAGLTIFRDSAGGFGDVALAAYVYEQARRQGCGVEIEF